MAYWRQEIDTYISEVKAYLSSPDAKIRASSAERKANYSVYQERLDHAIEAYVDAFQQHYNARENDVCETMMYVAHTKGHAWYLGNKYPCDLSTEEIIREYIADIRGYDHTGLYED